MQVRHQTHPSQVSGLDTAALRDHYLVEDLFRAGEVRTVYTHADRIVLGGAAPVPGTPLPLAVEAELRSTSFCERRELAVVAVRGSGRVVVDGESYELGLRDCLYVGRGAVDVVFHAEEDQTHFYLFSTPAHANFPTTVARFAEVDVVRLGEQSTANVREIRKFVHLDGIGSSQLVLGMTTLAEGSVWNTMPPHTHDRRTECYLYFDLPEQHRVVHLLGEPEQTRHVVLSNEQAVISPSWSIHSGAGTHSYSFVWAMAGENQAYDDMDPVDVTDLR
ncbi:5-dehydro-4-deoxy-D-glucuronate isomerase [Kutzneria viridogrisea]|uniref:4-deoxy-L-threo-5-hexosulose-uronate ketol-isomerase n=2 Tax=Kutzneria TaxID=43356 RepID=W5VYT7_9PSEU|nr:5-dehydro-4-deoxy-D-glucuronate isomerase [Kutzneria albida]AHH93717.1 4-deoxy-L-threo-5-hexosulose-uronate ketol-isomerase [Kutzneria albida DSM 43870]MBA8931279.1 4-deoxy-L-threo-5-hexosulose-uronate ketol-isomerase [Kutzneria viridogrisea]